MGTTEFNISTFKSNLSGGARAYLFEYAPVWPSTVSSQIEGSTAAYLVKATSLPEDSVEEIVANWQGADLKMAGKRTFADWTITFNVDRNSKLRETFDLWSNQMHEYTKDGDMDYGNLDEYMLTQELRMLDYNGDVINTLTMIDAWPKSVGAITLDYSSMEIASFDVTFTYQYHIFVLGGNA